MPTQTGQSGKQAALLTQLGIANKEYEASWHAFWTTQGIAAGAFDERMLGWLNYRLAPVTPYTNLPGAMQAFAERHHVYNWDSLVNPNLLPTGGAGGSGSPIGILLSITGA